MSITVTSEHTGFVGFVVACCPGAAKQAKRHLTEQDALAALEAIPGGQENRQEAIRSVLPGCEMPETCPEYRLLVEGVPAESAPWLNMNVRNAVRVFEVLGLADEVSDGEMEASEMLGRVLLARGLEPEDEGLPAIVEGRWTYGARPEGYIQERLCELETLARWARARDLFVVWG